MITSTPFNAGPAAGGNTYIIVGANLFPGCTVTFGGIPATIILNSSPMLINCMPPAGVVGPVPVVITTPMGCTVSTTYTYL